MSYTKHCNGNKSCEERKRKERRETISALPPAQKILGTALMFYPNTIVGDKFEEQIQCYDVVPPLRVRGFLVLYKRTKY